MKAKKSIEVSILGIIIAVMAFDYDGLFAGIPDQDPAPERQASYECHSMVAGMLYSLGGIVVIVGLVALLGYLTLYPLTL